MNLFRLYTDRVRGTLRQLAESGALPAPGGLDRVVVEPPKDLAHGDLATNAALVLAKDLGVKPRDIAETLAAALRSDPDIEDVSIAGPGFVNLRLKGDFWPGFLRTVLAAGADYGRTDLGAGRRVNVEYVSANPTGPLHVGHCRGAVFGDALANLLAFTGHDVTREYYVNDAGAQVDILARSVHRRYAEALGEEVGPAPEGLYPGDYLVPVGRRLAEEHGRALLGRPEAEWLPIVREAAVEAMMALIREDLAALDIRQDVFFSERSLSWPVDRVGETIEALRGRGLVYEGRLPPPKGQLPEDWEDREQTLFRSTAFGDDIDRPLKKSDGSYSYFAPDIAYHRDKVLRGATLLIDVLGADHGGYVKRLKAAVAAVSGGEAELDVKLCQLVKLTRGGEPVRMSKRSGDFVTLREVVEEVGRDVVRFMMLTRRNDAALDFDFVKVTEQSRDNPVFYVQYAHARAQSVFRNALETFPDLELTPEGLAGSQLERLAEAAETAVVRRLADFPRVVETAAAAHEPHRLAFYLYDLASDFHGLWTRGKDSPHLRFINSGDRELTRARLALVHAVALVLASGLRLLGVVPVNEMR